MDVMVKVPWKLISNSVHLPMMAWPIFAEGAEMWSAS